MSFAANIKPYIYKGLVMRHPTGLSGLDGNALLYTGHMLLMSQFHGELPGYSQNTWLGYLKEHWKETGVLRRAWKDETNSHDDYIGVCSVGYILKQPIPARAIANYGFKHAWKYDGKDHSRFLGVIQHYKHCAGLQLSRMDQLLWCIGILGKTLFSKGESGTLLAWNMVSVMEDYPVCKVMGNIWRWRIRKRHGDIGTVFAKYFETNHPLAKYGRGVI